MISRSSSSRPSSCSRSSIGMSRNGLHEPNSEPWMRCSKTVASCPLRPTLPSDTRSASAVSTSVPPLPRHAIAPVITSADIFPTVTTTTSAPVPRDSSPGQPRGLLGARHGVRGADRLGELPLQRDRVDADDVQRAGVHRALHRVRAHPAEADDDDRVARPHAAGVDRRAPAGRARCRRPAPRCPAGARGRSSRRRTR